MDAKSAIYHRLTLDCWTRLVKVRVEFMLKLNPYLLVLLCFFGEIAPANGCKHAQPNSRGGCAIDLPANAEKGYGGAWKCVRGYRKIFSGCIKVDIPENGELDYLGNDWKCKRGFYKRKDRCIGIVMPANSELNYLGNAWKCKRGFFRQGVACYQIVVPKNASLNYLGNGWSCDDGFKRSGSNCIRMDRQKQRAEQLKREMIYREIEYRQKHGYEIEHSYNDELFIINGEKFEARTYCFGFEEGDRVLFLQGSPFGTCVSAEILNLRIRKICDVWCE